MRSKTGKSNPSCCIGVGNYLYAVFKNFSYQSDTKKLLNCENSRQKSFAMVGGMGNQLFILTAGTYYSLKNKENVIFDVSGYADGIPPHGRDIRTLSPDVVFQNRPKRLVLNPYLNQILTITIFRPYLKLIKDPMNKILKRNRYLNYISPGLGYDVALESKIFQDNIFGYFQTYKYLEDPNVRNLIDLLHLDPVSDWFHKCSSEMTKLPTISVHVRRGDYMDLQDSFGVLSGEYFSSAIKFTLGASNKKYERVLVFSDEVDSAKQLFSNLLVGLPVYFVDSPGNNPEEELMLMSKSDALIMSNSSFSWWAAQLGNKSKFVVCPSKWFRSMLDPQDLIPPEWHQLESKWEI